MHGSLNFRNSACLILLAALLAGCGGGKETGGGGYSSSSSSTLKDFLATHESGFRPSVYDPPLDTLKTDNRAYDDVRPTLSFPTTALVDTIPGFRVQVLLTKDIDEASGVKAAVARYLPEEWVYIVYDLPYYKVRVGNYAERESANESARKLVSHGFSNSWVVPEKILRSPPPPPPPPVLTTPDSTGK